MFQEMPIKTAVTALSQLSTDGQNDKESNQKDFMKFPPDASSLQLQSNLEDTSDIKKKVALHNRERDRRKVNDIHKDDNQIRNGVGRTVSIDQGSFIDELFFDYHQVGEENTGMIGGGQMESKSKIKHVKSNRSIGLSVFTSPPGSTFRGDRMEVENSVVTPTQCKCKKSQCLKL